MPRYLDGDRTVILRTARQSYTCYGFRRPERNLAGAPCPTPAGAINPGDDYIEYLGESLAYESGYRYCEACGRREFAEWIAAATEARRVALEREQRAKETAGQLLARAASLAAVREQRAKEAKAARKAKRAEPLEPGSLAVKVPESICRLFSIDDPSIATLYEARYWTHGAGYMELRMTRAGATKLLEDVRTAMTGHWDGGSPQQNAGIVRSAEACAPKLAALIEDAEPCVLRAVAS